MVLVNWCSVDISISSDNAGLSVYSNISPYNVSEELLCWLNIKSNNADLSDHRENDSVKRTKIFVVWYNSVSSRKMRNWRFTVTPICIPLMNCFCTDISIKSKSRETKVLTPLLSTKAQFLWVHSQGVNLLSVNLFIRLHNWFSRLQRSYKLFAAIHNYILRTLYHEHIVTKRKQNQFTFEMLI